MAKARTYKDIIDLRDKAITLQRDLTNTQVSRGHFEKQAYLQNHHIATLMMELYSHGNKHPSRMRLSSTEPTTLSIIDTLERHNQIAIDVDNKIIRRAFSDVGFASLGSNLNRFIVDFNKDDTYAKFLQALETVFMRYIPETPQGDSRIPGDAPAR
jgi:hypothetical protein